MEQNKPSFLSKKLNKFRKLYQSLPDKKRYVEFLTALLTVPVLLTVIILNIQNLKSQQKPAEPTPTVTQVPSVTPFQGSPSIIPTKTVFPTAAESCSPTIAPVSIVSPRENERISKDPVCIDIAYEQGNSCGIVWSYRINDGNFSDYTDKAICLYGLSSGEKEITLKIKSLKGTDEKVLTRTFTIVGPTPTPTSTATNSAALQ